MTVITTMMSIITTEFPGCRVQLLDQALCSRADTRGKVVCRPRCARAGWVVCCSRPPG